MKLNKFLFVLLFLSCNFNVVIAQNRQVEVQLEPIEIDGLGGTQSYAFGQFDGKWLIIGGRLDGLHRRQPFASFDVAGHNTDLIVVDPVAKKQWRKSNLSLPVSVREQLSSTNMEFYQENDQLYVIGGYGYSPTINDYNTYPNLCVINVANVIDAIINNKELSPFFRQIKDNKFAVTGGYLHKIYDTYYLVGGQKFIGRYNPMGPTQGPGFIQEYTNAIRKFEIKDDGNEITIKHKDALINEEQLHRRDYNVAPQIFPNGRFGLTAFSGVFQKDVDLPFLNCVNIDSSGYTVQPDFNQYYNHYHCAHIPLYSSKYNEMHTLFFGGIAQYFDDNGVLTKDDNVPFVNTIARVTRTENGKMAEYKLKSTMPGLLGSGSEFILNNNIPTYENGVVNMDALEKDTTHLGYIYGGIRSSAPNIFFTNTGIQSSAHKQIFKVNFIKSESTSTNELNKQSQNGLGMTVFPNPGNGEINIQFEMKVASEVTITIFDISGRLINQYFLGNLNEGNHNFQTNDSFQNYKALLLKLQAGNKISVQKVIKK